MSAAEVAVRRALAAQRQAIVSKIEDCALHVLSTDGDEGAAVTAAILRQAAEIARWTIYDPEAGIFDAGDGVALSRKENDLRKELFGAITDAQDDGEEWGEVSRALDRLIEFSGARAARSAARRMRGRIVSEIQAHAADHSHPLTREERDAIYEASLIAEGVKLQGWES